MSNPIKNTSNATDICELVDINASVQEQMMAAIQLNGSGLLAVQRGNGTSYNVEVERGLDGIVSGIGVTIGTSPSALVVTVGTGLAQLNGARIVRGASGTVTLSAGDPTSPRIDLIALNLSGNVVVTSGTPASNPAAPGTPSNQLPIAYAYVRPNASGTNERVRLYRITQPQVPISGTQLNRAQATYSTALGRFVASNCPVMATGAANAVHIVTLVAGTVTINQDDIRSTDYVYLTPADNSGTAGHLWATVTDGSLTINSTSATDTRQIRILRIKTVL
jgi:hypothetical protein